MLHDYASGKFLRELDGIGVMQGSVYEKHSYHPLVMSMAEEFAGRVEGENFRPTQGDNRQGRIVSATGVIMNLLMHMAERGYAVVNLGTADHKDPKTWAFQRPELVASTSSAPGAPGEDPRAAMRRVESGE